MGHALLVIDFCRNGWHLEPIGFVTVKTVATGGHVCYRWTCTQRRSGLLDLHVAAVGPFTEAHQVYGPAHWRDPSVVWILSSGPSRWVFAPGKPFPSRYSSFPPEGSCVVDDWAMK